MLNANRISLIRVIPDSGADRAERSSTVNSAGAKAFAKFVLRAR